MIRKYFTFIRGLSVLIFLKIRILSLLAGWIESFVCGIYTFRSKLTLLRVIVYNVILIFVGLVLLKDLVDIVKNVEFLFLIEIIYRKCERKKIVIIY